jgi:ATPase subunit of ABC transporter with duplicated ATPase domains
MARISIEDLCFGFTTPLFDRLHASFEDGWTGLVGANGCGKTTLLRLIAGDLQPLSGRVRSTPEGSVVWCRQQSSDQRRELEEFALDTSKAAQRWRGLLGVDPDSLERFDQLSAGERKRWQLALALGSEPGVLLLDEPTNHLDGEARQLLTRALSRFAGVGILVSHDRTLLDTLTTRTARLGRNGLEVSVGNYAASQARAQAERESLLAAKTEKRRERDRVEARAVQQRESALRAEADRSSSKRMRDKNDHDARGMLRKNKAEAAGRRLAQTAAALGSRLGRVERELSELRVEKTLGRDLFAEHVPWPKPIVFSFHCDALCRGSRRLLGRTTLDIARDDKLVMIGANGCGKTSLLRELERQNGKAFAQSVYLPQSLPPDVHDSLQATLRGLAADARGRALNIVAALGSAPDAVLASTAWSPGETRKVALAIGLAQHAPSLILDEPTNHFDLPSIERLERLLVEYPGCVVMVTHDHTLAARVATRIMSFEGAELVERAIAPALAGRTPELSRQTFTPATLDVRAARDR